jgi:hypothetical protein
MDRELGRRLERAESSIGTSFIAVRQRLSPEVGATWHDFDGTYAIFDGADSPMTQTFGLGMYTDTTDDALAAIEAYFGERGAPAMHEVCSLAPTATMARLASRGYLPIEQSSVLVQEIGEPVATTTPLRVRVIQPADHETWVETSVGGWASEQQYANVIRRLAEVAAANDAMTHFLVERDGEPIATASLGVHGDIALFAGASTVPSGRGQGAQNLLLSARIAEARRRGCTLALMIADPGSTSQRNAERSGFRIAYTRSKWRRERPGEAPP